MARTIGICSRTGSAVAVAIEDATLLRRWTLDLTEGRVPAQPFHAAAGRDDAAAFIRRAVDTVTEVAERRLRELLAEVGPVAAVAVVTGDHPVPDEIATILAAHTLMHAAEGQLYRDALLDAATALGLRSVGMPRGRLAQRLAGDLAGTVAALGRAAGPPWRKEHKLAAVAALQA